jgi:PAS domain S-box-containing protein
LISGDDKIVNEWVNRTKEELISEIERLNLELARQEQNTTDSASNISVDHTIREVIDTLNQGIYIHRDFKIVYANSAMAEMFGYGSVAELLALDHVSVFYSEAEWPTILGRAIDRKAGNSAPEQYEAIGVRKDGTEFELNLRPARIVWEGEPAIFATLFDVSDRASAQREVESQLLFLQTLLDAIPFPVFYKDENHIYRGCNEEFSKFIGIPAQDVIGASVYDVAPRDLADIYRKADDELMGNGGVQVYEASVRYSDGSHHDVLFHKRVYQKPDGSVGGLIGAMLDITERKRLEKESEESRQSLQALIDYIPELVILKDVEGKIQYVNRCFENWMQMTRLEAEGKSVHDVFDPKRAAAVDLHDAKIIETREVIAVESKIDYPDGVLRNVYSRRFPVVKSSGELLGIGVITSDITAQKNSEQAIRESEDQLKTLVENVPDPLFVHTIDGEFVEVNEKAVESLGYTREQLMKMSVNDIIVSTPNANLKATWQTMHGTEILKGQHRHIDGHIIPVEVHVSRFGSEKSPLFLATARDISEREQVERELVIARDRAEHANRAKSEFLANMSHELRTPLNSIIGFSEVIQTEVFGRIGERRYGEYIDDIHHSGCHLLNVINDILDMSKIEAQQLEVQEEEIDLRDVIRDCERMVYERAERGRLKLTTKIDTHLPKIWADERRLSQILINLLSNAIKFTDDGGVVSIICRQNKRRDIELIVEDTGDGIPENDLSQVFEPFIQAREHSTQTHEGTGLGLALVKALTGMHGGDVSLTSELGKGTRVTVTLPSSRLVN